MPKAHRFVTVVVSSVLLVSSVAPAQEGNEPRPIRRSIIVVGDGQKSIILDVPDSPRLDLGTAVLLPENFDRRVFGQDRQTTRGLRMDELLSAKLKGASREHRLEDAERAKLDLAGRGDVKRLFDQVEEERADFEVSRMTFKDGRKALARLDSLSRIYQDGPFEDGSLFAKVLAKILADREAAVGATP